jgi:hypothetical protein
MDRLQKITVHIPEDLLAEACRVTGSGVTETVRQGLQALAAAKAADDLRKLRGRLKLRIDVAKLRRDRR